MEVPPGQVVVEGTDERVEASVPVVPLAKEDPVRRGERLGKPGRFDIFEDDRDDALVGLKGDL